MNGRTQEGMDGVQEAVDSLGRVRRDVPAAARASQNVNDCEDPMCVSIIIRCPVLMTAIRIMILPVTNLLFVFAVLYIKGTYDVTVCFCVFSNSSLSFAHSEGIVLG